MITLYLNCAQVWVRLVRLWCRITRRPQVTFVAPAHPGAPARRDAAPAAPTARTTVADRARQEGTLR